MRLCIRAFIIVPLLSGCAHHVTTASSTATPMVPLARATSRPVTVARILPSFVPVAPSAAPVTPAPQQHAVTPTPIPFFFLASPHPYTVVTPHPIGIGFPAFLRPLPFLTPPPILIATPAAVPQLAPDAAPQIIRIELPSSVVYGGDLVTGDVIASSNVASIEVRVAGYGRSMEKTGPGHFTLSVAVPRLPFFLRRRTYTLTVIARNARGDAVVQTVPITVR